MKNFVLCCVAHVLLAFFLFHQKSCGAACLPGTFGVSTCQPCPQNYFSAAAGQTACQPCPSGTIAAPGASVCGIPCGYLQMGWQLTPCPTDAYCPDNNT